MRKLYMIAILLIYILSLCFTTTTFAQGQLPCRFHGTVKLNYANVPDGTTIVATINDDTFTTKTPSDYGPSTYLLQITPPIGKTYNAGDDIIFRIGTNPAEQIGKWETGGNKILNLSFSSITPTPTSTPTPEFTPTPSPSPTPTPTPQPGILNLEGKINPENSIINEEQHIPYLDNPVSLLIYEKTKATNSQGQTLSNISLEPADNIPPPPKGYNIIGQAYVLKPNGAQFDPPALLTMGYEEEDLHDNIIEKDLRIAYYKTVSYKWENLKSTVDMNRNEITAKVSHFTVFAILGPIESDPVSIWVIISPIIILILIFGISFVLLRFY